MNIHHSRKTIWNYLPDQKTLSATLVWGQFVASKCYNATPRPIRPLLDFPVAVAKVIQRNTFPTILFTEGYHVFRQNFGLTRDKLVNNILLGGMIACTISKFYVNPWFDHEHQEIDAIWYKMGDQSISNEEYYETLFNSIWSFSKALSVMVATQILNAIFQSLLNRIITFKKQYEFAQEWLKNHAIYGIKVTKVSSDTEEDVEVDNEKLNLNPVKLLDDIENQNALLSLWNSRINTIIDCVTAITALSVISPSMIIPYTYIVLPKLIVLSFAYSLVYNAILSPFESVSRKFLQIINQLQDRIIRQVTNIDTNAELITALDGEEFEAKKLLKLLNEKRLKSIRYDIIDSFKSFITNYIDNFDWLFPILATVKNVRSGEMKQEEVGPCMHHYFRINRFITWAKTQFTVLNSIEESVRRLSLYRERLQAWSIIRAEIMEKVTNAEEIYFSGSIYTDEKKSTLLAKGIFTLKQGSITHLDAPSGSGKTTLFRIFDSDWNEFDGECTLPKDAFFYLPSHPYILGPDEPLFQTVCYPINHEKHADKSSLVEKWFKQLELPSRIYAKLENCSNNEANNFITSLSDGERKRIFFCNMLLKLHIQDIKFLMMDEPFKGIGWSTQETMVALLKEYKAEDCTVLFSNHEDNHGLNTHRLAINSEDRMFELEEMV